MGKGIGLHNIVFSIIAVAVFSLMVSPTSAFAEKPAWCDGMASNDKVSSGGEQMYKIVCTDNFENNSFSVLNNLIAPQVISSVGPNNQINADPPGTELISSNTQSEVSGASDPTGQSVVIGWNDSEQFLATGSFNGYARSADGGANWVDGGAFPIGPDHILGGDPVIAYSPNVVGGAAHIHASLATDFSPVIGPALSAITIQRSNDGGVTWGNPINVATSATDFLDKEWIATGPNPAGGFDIIHASWTSFIGGNCNLSCPIQYSRSLDGGNTWTAPITFNFLGASQGSFIVVDPTGNNVYVFWQDFVSGNQVVNISNDAGASFGNPVTIAPINFAGIFDNDCQRFTWNGQHRINQFVSAAINPVNGDLYVTWADGEVGNPAQTDIVVYRSTNGGANWAQVTTPHPALPDNDQFIPFMDTAPDGEIKMIWYDRRNDANNLAIELWASSSTDGGTTWAANTLVSTASFTAPSLSPNPDPIVNPCYFVGEYNVIIVPTTTFAHAAWGDGRNPTDGTNVGAQAQPDIFYSLLEQDVPPMCGNGVVDSGEDCDPTDPSTATCCDASTCMFESSTTVCRTEAGLCDIAETCSGSSETCPADILEPSGTECREADGVCDVAETCEGTVATCPADAFAPDTTSCEDGNVCTEPDMCDGSGACSSGPPVDSDACIPDEVPVGGEFLPINSAALLVAGMQTNSVWILSALAAVGITAFGALYISARRK